MAGRWNFILCNFIPVSYFSSLIFMKLEEIGTLFGQKNMKNQNPILVENHELASFWYSAGKHKFLNSIFLSALPGLNILRIA